MLLEDCYSVADAVVVGGLLISLLRHSDRVASASLAQLVNVIAPIMTESGGRAWKQTTFHPFAQMSRLAIGNVLQVHIRGTIHDTKRYGQVTDVDAVATHDPDTGAVTVFAINRSGIETCLISLDLRSFPGTRLVEATQLSRRNPYASANADNAEEFIPAVNLDTTWNDTTLTVMAPAVSWNVIRLERTPQL